MRYACPIDYWYQVLSSFYQPLCFTQLNLPSLQLATYASLAFNSSKAESAQESRAIEPLECKGNHQKTQLFNDFPLKSWRCQI